MARNKIISKEQTKPNGETQVYLDLLRTLTPKKSVYRLYLRESDEFIDEYSTVMEMSPELIDKFPIKGLTILHSELFSLKYLVAYVDSTWFNSIAPGCDAVASPEFNMGPFRSPPIVLVPETKIGNTDVAFRSTLEHEYVHINQALLGNFPAAEGFVKDPIRSMFEIVESEYQANFLQLSRWPTLYKKAKKLGVALSLRDWCILRGYSQALEAVLMAIMEDQLTGNDVEKFLRILPKKLPLEFQKLGFEKKQGLQFAANLPNHLTIAVTNILDGGVRPKNLGGRGLIKLNNWIKQNLKTVST